MGGKGTLGLESQDASFDVRFNRVTLTDVQYYVRPARRAFPLAVSPAHSAPEPVETSRKSALERLEQHVDRAMRDVSSVDEAEMRIEELVGDPEYHRLYHALGDATTLGIECDAFDTIESSLPSALVHAVGVDRGRELQLGAQLEAAIWGASLQLAGRRRPQSRRAPKLVSDPLEYLTSVSIPTTVRRAYLGAQKAEVALIAMGGSKRRLPDWLASALVERWIDGNKGLLRLLAGVDGVEIPPGLIADSERVDIADMERQYGRAESGYQERLADARRAAMDVYPTPPRPIDD
jgi:hypothetical protein